MIKIGTALFEACEELERERGISKEVLIASLCDAMVAAYKKHMRLPKEVTNIEAILDEQSGEIGVFSTKLVVDEVEDNDLQISECCVCLPEWFQSVLAAFSYLQYMLPIPDL